MMMDAAHKRQARKSRNNGIWPAAWSRGRWAGLLALLCSGALSMPRQLQAIESPSEQEVSIAFGFNFLRFSEWPANSVNGILNLCVTHNTPMERELAAIDGRSIQNKTLSVYRLSWGESVDRCHALFVPREEKNARIQEWLKLAAGKPIFLIGNSPGFLEMGGMIVLVLDGVRMQFEIDLSAINAAGLKLSGQLLKIARDVRGLPEK